MLKRENLDKAVNSLKGLPQNGYNWFFLETSACREGDKIKHGLSCFKSVNQTLAGGREEKQWQGVRVLIASNFCDITQSCWYLPASDDTVCKVEEATEWTKWVCHFSKVNFAPDVAFSFFKYGASHQPRVTCFPAVSQNCTPVVLPIPLDKKLVSVCCKTHTQLKIHKLVSCNSLTSLGVFNSQYIWRMFYVYACIFVVGR